MTKPILYLAGPITGQTYAGATDWREYARNALWPHIEARSPMRGKAYLAAMVDPIGGTPDEAYTRHAISSVAGVVARDRNDVYTCGAVLAYLRDTDRASIGTMVEFGWADAFRKPIITVLDKSGPHYHMFVTQLSGYVVETLEEGLQIARILLAPPTPAELPDLAGGTK